MNLQPPSYFEVPPGPSQGDEKMEKAVVTKWREEITRLNMENKVLRQRLEICRSPPPILTDVSSPPPPTSPRALCPHPPPPVSPDLHTDDCFEDRLRRLEGENMRLSRRVLELDQTLVLRKKEYQQQLVNLKARHDGALMKAESESHKLRMEYQVYVEDKERQLKLLAAEVAMQKEQCTTKLDEQLQKNSRLEHKLLAAEADKNSAVHQLESRIVSLTKKLDASEKERDNLKACHNAQLSSLTAQVTSHCEKVKELEAYLGGEIPCAEGGEKFTGTWKEEREMLHSKIQKHERDVQKLNSENYLLNVRLSSMSEILSLQEADITKNRGEHSEDVKTLLTRWREKVYSSMVQQKLEEIEGIRSKKHAQIRETTLHEKVEKSERERQILSHSLADKAAELRLQETRTQEFEASFRRASIKVDTLQQQLGIKSAANARIRKGLGGIVQLYTDFKTCFNQALTQIANYEHRLKLTNMRLHSLRATLGCQQALLRGKLAGRVTDAECQAGGGLEEEEEEEAGLSALTKNQLQLEVQSLSRERDSLTTQLQESTMEFQQQLKLLQEKYLSESSNLEGQLAEIKSEHTSLEVNYSELQAKHCTSEEARTRLSKMSEQLNQELESLQSTMESRVQSALSKQQQRNREDLSEMEKLLGVARREHSKAILQLQQLTRKVSQDKERAVEAAEMVKARTEEELEACRKKLQSTQVERNLILTARRQEEAGLSLPSRNSRPKQSDLSQSEDESPLITLNYDPLASEHGPLLTSAHDPLTSQREYGLAGVAGTSGVAGASGGPPDIAGGKSSGLPGRGSSGLTSMAGAAGMSGVKRESVLTRQSFTQPPRPSLSQPGHTSLTRKSEKMVGHSLSEKKERTVGFLTQEREEVAGELTQESEEMTGPGLTQKSDKTTGQLTQRKEKMSGPVSEQTGDFRLEGLAGQHPSQQAGELAGHSLGQLLPGQHLIEGIAGQGLSPQAELAGQKLTQLSEHAGDRLNQFSEKAEQKLTQLTEEGDETEDIRDVLHDLHMLSASLLSTCNKPELDTSRPTK